jgi:hypothetical protein
MPLETKEDENRLLKTAHFNSAEEFSVTNSKEFSSIDKTASKFDKTGNQNKNYGNDHTKGRDELLYLKEMEDNMKLFEIKMKRIENSNSSSNVNSVNTNYNIKKYAVNDETEKKYSNKSSRNQGIYNLNANNTNQRNIPNFSLQKPDLVFTPKEKNTFISIYEYEQLKNEIKFKDSLIEELKIENQELNVKLESESSNNNKVDDYFHNSNPEKYLKEIENLYNGNNKKEDEKRKLNDEIEKLKSTVEKLKKENTSIKNIISKRDIDLSVLNDKYNEIEQNKNILERKNNTDESQMKNLKMEYSNIVKNLNLMKKQFENLTNKFEEFKAENYNLKQENNELKKKFSTIEKSVSKNNNVNISVNINKSMSSMEQFKDNFNNYNSNNSIENPLNQNTNINPNSSKNKFNANHYINYRNDDEVVFPSEYKLKENKNELIFIEQKLSDLLKEKLITENELLRLPDKPRTLNEINKKKGIEESLLNLENEINDVKLRMRKLNIKNK